MTRVFTTPSMDTIVAQCTLDGGLVIKKGVDFHLCMPSTDEYHEQNTTGRDIALKYPHLTGFLMSTGILFQKDVTVKMEKYKERLGGEVLVFNVDEYNGFLMFGADHRDASKKYNAVLITPVYTCKAYLKPGRVNFCKKNESVTYAYALLRAVDKVLEERSQEYMKNMRHTTEKYRGLE